MPGVDIIDEPRLKARRNEPSFSLTVAYREFARGHDCRLHSPVTLYSFRQKFCVVVLRNESFATCWLAKNLLDFVWAELLIYHRPYDIVTLHAWTDIKFLKFWMRGRISQRGWSDICCSLLCYALSFSSSIELQTLAKTINSTSFTTTELSDDDAILPVYFAMSRLSFRYTSFRAAFRTRGFEPCPGRGHYVGHGWGYRWKHSKYDQQYGHEGWSRKSKPLYSIQLTLMILTHARSIIILSRWTLHK